MGITSAIRPMLEKTQHVTKLWVDGGVQRPKLASNLGNFGLGSVLETINSPADIRGHGSASPLDRGTDRRPGIAPRESCEGQ